MPVDTKVALSSCRIGADFSNKFVKNRPEHMHIDITWFLSGTEKSWQQALLYAGDETPFEIAKTRRELLEK